MAPSRPRTLSLRALTVSFRGKAKNEEPPSPTFSESTNVSSMHFGDNGPEKIITRANLKSSIHAYEDLLNVAAEYCAALLSMSKITARFADALENCSGLKGPSYETGTKLQAASGLHHLIGNHWHLLAETIERKFEQPLRQHLDVYRIVVQERSATYEKALREKSQIIRDTESRSLNKRERNLQTFREALTVLQRQVDDLDDLKASHYREIIEHEEQVWDVVQAKTCVVVRSSMDVFDRFTAKGSDPVLEQMLQTVPDPFDSYGPPQAENKIFSILAPLSLMSTQPTSPGQVSPEGEGSAGPSTSSSWIPQGLNGGVPTESTSKEWAQTPDTDVTPTPSPPYSPTPVLSRRQSASSPPGSPQRKSESKLRNVLTVIDEVHSLPDSKQKIGLAPNGRQTPPTIHSEPVEWASTYGQSPYNILHEDITSSSITFPKSPNIPPGTSASAITEKVDKVGELESS